MPPAGIGKALAFLRLLPIFLFTSSLDASNVAQMELPAHPSNKHRVAFAVALTVLIFFPKIVSNTIGLAFRGCITVAAKFLVALGHQLTVELANGCASVYEASNQILGTSVPGSRLSPTAIPGPAPAPIVVNMPDNGSSEVLQHLNNLLTARAQSSPTHPAQAPWASWLDGLKLGFAVAAAAAYVRPTA